MKKILLVFGILPMFFLVAACSNNDTEKVEGELEEEIMAEVEADANKIEKLSDEELVNKKDEYEQKLHSFLNNIPNTYSGLFWDKDITQFKYYQDKQEFKEYVDMVFSLGYGIEMGEGYYYLYVGEPVGYHNVEIDQSSATNGNDTNNDRIVVGTYDSGKKFDFIIEEDTSKEVVSGVPVNYLFMKHANGEKELLAKSVDRGNDWTDSIAKILSPTMSNDGKKVYYSTDNTFSRTSGYGANNYRTRLLDLDTLKDTYFAEGALVTILNNSHGPYEDHVVLEIYSKDSAGNLMTVFKVVTPNGEQLVILETPGNWQAAIDAKLSGSQNANQSTEIGEGVRLSGFANETVRGEQIDYSKYSAVIIPFYSGGNYNKLASIPFIDHPDGMVLDFAVFGKLQDVVITRYQHMDDPGEEFYYGEIENAIFNIHSNLPFDMGYYAITGRVHTGEGFFEEVEFGLDDMASETEFDVILVR